MGGRTRTRKYAFPLRPAETYGPPRPFSRRHAADEAPASGLASMRFPGDLLKPAARPDHLAAGRDAADETLYSGEGVVKKEKRQEGKPYKTIPTVLQADARLEASASFHDIALSDGEAIRFSVTIFVQADRLSPL